MGVGEGWAYLMDHMHDVWEMRAGRAGLEIVSTCSLAVMFVFRLQDWEDEEADVGTLFVAHR